MFEEILGFLNPEFLNNLKSSDTPFKTNLNANKLQDFENIFSTFNFLPTDETNLTTHAKCVLVNMLSDILLNIKNHLDYNKMPSLIKNIISLLNTTDGIMYGIPSVIKQYNYSPIYLSRLFKKYLGITMTDYLKNVRLNYAELYLQTTSLTLEEITEQVGLASMSYLNKIFKEKHGTTPIKYRNAYRKNTTDAN
jgi:AraC family cel operon transcriptional repressor